MAAARARKRILRLCKIAQNIDFQPSTRFEVTTNSCIFAAISDQQSLIQLSQVEGVRRSWRELEGVRSQMVTAQSCLFYGRFAQNYKKIVKKITKK
jgi:hypothetical protein